ncbi:MAG: bifunctional hydroxymethylpyrimidine kinase/phosphomethylpyrimidine kinase [Magnetococcales bacterium]|nr:bifunctional hydroxymethylpyrimidine kinase/phosphomethylpyrimidine kinase [Magnetococcales bacterium]
MDADPEWLSANDAPPPKRVLVVAGSDPAGGAGLQADLKTISALGGYGMAVVTALTVQSTRKVFRVEPVDAALVAQQLRTCLDDMGADCIKLGMLASKEIVAAVAAVLELFPDIPVVADPVMSGTNGGILLEEAGLETYLTRLLPRISLVTPNLQEAERLSGISPVNDLTSMENAALNIAEKMATTGNKGAVLVTGGHLTGTEVIDVLHDGWFLFPLRYQRLIGPDYHGSGCALSSAISVGLADGYTIRDAVEYGIKAVRTGMLNGYGVRGRGLINHAAMAEINAKTKPTEV